MTSTIYGRPQAGVSAGSLEARHGLIEQYMRVRRTSEQLCQSLEIEDYVIQSMPDVSPVKWHLAHTTWFFETLILAAALPGYQPPHPQYHYLFNSYYVSLGERHCRPGVGCYRARR